MEVGLLPRSPQIIQFLSVFKCMQFVLYLFYMYFNYIQSILLNITLAPVYSACIKPTSQLS